MLICSAAVGRAGGGDGVVCGQKYRYKCNILPRAVQNNCLEY